MTTYIMRTTADASGGGGNQAPVVSAGTNFTGNTLTNTLAGSASDDGLPGGGLTTAWTQVSGPTGGVASFSNAASVTSDVSFSQPGTYVLRLTGDDGALQTTSDVTVTVGLQLNFGSEFTTAQPTGYVKGSQDYTTSHGWTNNPNNGTVPQTFDRTGASTDVLLSNARIDAWNSGTPSFTWNDAGIGLIYRVDVPDNGTWNVDVTVGDSALYGENDLAYFEVSGDNGGTWTSVFNGTVQNTAVTNTVAVSVTSGFILGRGRNTAGTVGVDVTALAAMIVKP